MVERVSGSDDTRRHIDGLDLSAPERRKLFEMNARRVYPRPARADRT